MSSHRSRAIFTPSTARRMISSFAILSLKSRWMGLVARKTWMRFRAASARAFADASMSPLLQRERLQMVAPSTWRATPWMASKSPGDAAAKPASMTSTPRSRSAFATCSFCGRFIEAPGDCSPSRRVVSKTTTRSEPGSLTSPLPFLSGAVAPRPMGESSNLPECPADVTGIPTAQMDGVSAPLLFDMRSGSWFRAEELVSPVEGNLFGRFRRKRSRRALGYSPGPYRPAKKSNFAAAFHRKRSLAATSRRVKRGRDSLASPDHPQSGGLSPATPQPVAE